jgi:adenylylsulfate kinase
VPGLQETYEAPLHPDLTIDTTKVPANEAAEMILKMVKGKFV